MQPEENAAQPAAQNTPEPTPAPAASLRDAKLESAHAELPPMSVIGGETTPAAKPGEIAKPRQFGRRGTPQGMPPAAGAGSSASIGAVSNPSEITEKLSGQHANGYAGGGQGGEPRPRREDRGPRPEGDFRRDDRGPREPRPEGDRPRREPRPEGEFRREDRGPRPEGERRRDDRGPREPRPERARIHIEPVVIPLEPPRSIWGSVKRLFATLWGVPSKAEFTPAPRAPREERRDDRGGHRHGGDRRRDDRGRGRGGRGRGGPRRG